MKQRKAEELRSGSAPSLGEVGRGLASACDSLAALAAAMLRVVRGGYLKANEKERGESGLVVTITII